jgi:ribokinase
VELDVLVVGSVNVDVIARVPVLPAPGTTVTGGTLERHGGGKGANQAVAAARLGARVGLIAAVGDDPDGAEAVADLRRERIDVSGIAMLENTATGVALIVVDDGGENQIAVASGANQELDAATVAAALDRIELTPGGVCLVGFEVSDAAIEVAAQWASAGGHRVLIVPAPARRLTEALIACAPILTPNAGEAAELSDESSPRAAAVALSRRTTSPVAVTLGKSGVVVADGDLVEAIPAYETTPMDTTGAGDTFSGALAVGLAESRPFIEAVQRAQAAAALSTRTVGARTGMPTSVELEVFLADRVPD